MNRRREEGAGRDLPASGRDQRAAEQELGRAIARQRDHARSPWPLEPVLHDA
jgi:hypothetical protein